MDLLMQGIVLMVIGMTTVFAFLVLLIFAMNRSAAFFKKFAHRFPETEPRKVPLSTPTDPTLKIAIALAAIHAKRG